jgi:hypothetical protein
VPDLQKRVVGFHDLDANGFLINKFDANADKTKNIKMLSKTVMIFARLVLSKNYIYVMEKQGQSKNETILSTDRAEKYGNTTLDRTLLSTSDLFFASSGLNEPFFARRVKCISPGNGISVSCPECAEIMSASPSASKKESANRLWESIRGLLPKRPNRAARDTFWASISFNFCRNKKIAVSCGVKRVHFGLHRTKVLFFVPHENECSVKLSFLRSYG